jgi:hypothetical protein
VTSSQVFVIHTLKLSLTPLVFHSLIHQRGGQGAGVVYDNAYAISHNSSDHGKSECGGIKFAKNVIKEYYVIIKVYYFSIM